MPTSRITCGCNLTLAQRMAAAYHTDETVAEQRLSAQFGTAVLADAAAFIPTTPPVWTADAKVLALYQSECFFRTCFL